MVTTNVVYGLLSLVLPLMVVATPGLTNGRKAFQAREKIGDVNTELQEGILRRRGCKPLAGKALILNALQNSDIGMPTCRAVAYTALGPTLKALGYGDCPGCRGGWPFLLAWADDWQPDRLAGVDY